MFLQDVKYVQGDEDRLAFARMSLVLSWRVADIYEDKILRKYYSRRGGPRNGE